VNVHTKNCEIGGHRFWSTSLLHKSSKNGGHEFLKKYVHVQKSKKLFSVPRYKLKKLVLKNEKSKRLRKQILL